MEKPARPLSSFNLFYRYKRAVVIERVGNDPSKEDAPKILSSIVGLEGNSALESTDQQPPFSDEINALRRSRIRETLKDKILPTARKAVRRRHRKAANSMGISFIELGKLMTTQWKGIDSFGKEIFDELAGEGRQIYRDKMEEYTKLNPPPKKSAPNNDKPKKNKAKDAGVEVTGVEVRKKSVSITAHTDTDNTADKVPAAATASSEEALFPNQVTPEVHLSQNGIAAVDTKEEAKPINPAYRMPIPHLATFFQRKTPITVDCSNKEVAALYKPINESNLPSYSYNSTTKEAESSTIPHLATFFQRKTPITPSTPYHQHQFVREAVGQYNPFKESNIPPFGRTYDKKVEAKPSRSYPNPRFVPLAAPQRQPRMAPIPTAYHQHYTGTIQQYYPFQESILPPYAYGRTYGTKVEAKSNGDRAYAHSYAMAVPHSAAPQRQRRSKMAPLPTKHHQYYPKTVEQYNPYNKSKQPSDRWTNDKKVEATPSSRARRNNMDVLVTAAATMAGKSKRKHSEALPHLAPKKVSRIVSEAVMNERF